MAVQVCTYKVFFRVSAIFKAAVLGVFAGMMLIGCDGLKNASSDIDADFQEALEKLKDLRENSSSFTRGIDVSHWNGQIDWQAVSSDGIKFAYIKISEGKSFIDPEFSQNWQNAQSNNILIGAYHTFTPGDDGTAQADFFLKTLGNFTDGYLGHLPPALDIEPVSSDKLSVSTSEIMAWLDTVEQGLGCAPIVYISPNTANTEFPGDFTSYRLWLADFDLTPSLPAGWQSWLFWQYTDKESTTLTNKGAKASSKADTATASAQKQPLPDLGTMQKVRGIQGDTDLDLFQGNLHSLTRTTCSGGL